MTTPSRPPTKAAAKPAPKPASRPAPSTKSIAERLQMKGDRRLAVLGAPPEVEAAIGAAEARAPLGSADVVLAFAQDRAHLDVLLPDILGGARRDAILWVAYRKLTSARAGDLNRDLIHGLVPHHGLDTVAQIAIDADWSALRLKRVGS